MTVPPDRRPAYHLTPRRNWMNDPNGLIHHGGRWHAYFQYNPQGDLWGNMSWGHASSPDLVHWTEHEVALRHTEQEVFYSGSIVAADDGTLAAFYTSVTPDRHQAQAMASSRDGGMTWEQYIGNPVIDRGSQEFRDPKLTWYDGPAGRYWVMATVEAKDLQVLFHRSEDLVTWTHLSTFGPAGPDAGHWECPDLFPLVDEAGREWWVLVVSLNPGGVAGGSGTMWFVGDFDGTSYAASDWGWLDRGPDHYAGVTFADAPEGRRVLLAWMSNWDYAREVPTSPFRGAMTVPRELGLRTVDGGPRLVQRPVRELDVLGPRQRVRLAGAPAAGEVVEVDLLTDDEGHRTVLTWADGILTLDRTRSGETGFHPAFPTTASAPAPLLDGRLDLDILLDTCSVEVLAQDGLVSLTMLVFPPEGADGLAVRGPVERVATAGQA